MNSIEKKILIIDDDASLTEMYGMKFEIDGWNVQKVHEGVAGLREISIFKPDIVLLDIMMPGLDGFQTLKFIMQKITNEKIKCKVVMFTNLSGNENEEKSKKLGASGYLMKANTTPREAVIRATEILMETPSEEAMKRTESIIEEIDGKFLTDCPGCGIRVEIKMNDEGRPSTIVLV